MSAEKKLAKQARKASKSGGHLEAAQLFEQAGEIDDAVESYLAAHAPERAAVLLSSAGRFKQAAQLYEKLGRPIAAAELYERGKAFKQAAVCYERAGRPYRRARVLLADGDWLGGAAALEEIGLWRQAAEACEHGQDKPRAAALYRKAYEEELARHGDEPASKAHPTVNLARRAGRLFAESGQTSDAALILEKAGLYDDIADVFRRTGDIQKAADYLARGGRLEDAARVLEEGGDPTGAERMRGEVSLAKGQTLEAIQHFEKAGAFARAAELYEKLGDVSNAGRLYEEAGDFARAAECFAKTGDPSRTAVNYERAERWREASQHYAKSGNSAKATEMLEKAGAKYEVGKAYFERGMFDQAIRALQAINAGEPDAAKGKRLLGDIFREKGMLSLAIKNYQLAVGSAEVGPENLDTYYQMAICQEKDGALDQALGIYERILVADYHFQDVAGRVQKLKRQLSQQTPSSAGRRATPSHQGISGGVTGGTPQVGRFDATVYQNVEPGAGEKRRYEVVNELGRGGMGIVYKARDTMLDREVALKVLPPALRTHPQALQNFLREAKSAAALNHPNIVTVYDVGEEAGDTYISMEYVEGKTIKELLVEDKRIPFKATLIIAGQLCRALQYAHEKKVVHRDIKPSNIMWTEKKEVKLMDFGLAKVLKEVTNQTTRLAGTPFYMSPEQTKGENVDHRTDLYSLGITLYEMLTGELPFPEGDIAYHHVHSPVPSVLDKVSDIPRAFDEVVTTLMQKNPDDRYQTAQEVFEALKKAAT